MSEQLAAAVAKRTQRAIESVVECLRDIAELADKYAAVAVEERDEARARITELERERDEARAEVEQLRRDIALLRALSVHSAAVPAITSLADIALNAKETA